MSQITLLAPQTAVVGPVPFESAGYANVLLSAGLLAADSFTISVAITPPVGGTFYVPALNAAGTAITLTAASPSCILMGGPTYAFTKVGTADSAGLYMFGQSNSGEY